MNRGGTESIDSEKDSTKNVSREVHIRRQGVTHRESVIAARSTKVFGASRKTRTFDRVLSHSVAYKSDIYFFRVNVLKNCARANCAIAALSMGGAFAFAFAFPRAAG